MVPHTRQRPIPRVSCMKNHRGKTKIEEGKERKKKEKKTHQSGWEEHQKAISSPPPIYHPLHSSLLRPHPQIQYPSLPESLPNPRLITIKIHRIPIVVVIIVIVVAMIQQLRRY